MLLRRGLISLKLLTVANASKHLLWDSPCSQHCPAVSSQQPWGGTVSTVPVHKGGIRGFCS